MSARTPRSKARQAEILAAGIRICSQAGHGDASLREIAERAGIKKGLLTYYFPTKEQLLFAIGLDMHEHFDALLARTLADVDAPPRTRLKAHFEAHVLLTCELVDQIRVSYESGRHLDRAHRDEIGVLRERYEAGVGQLIDACRPEGWVDDAATPALAVAALGLLNWVYLWYRPGGPLQPEDIARQVSQRAMASLRAAP
ncbi:MAG TPA: TetR/AcrR family transcriptional regulator [Ilumatobacter sp.]|nr:TetR/AcrR family transcriptional regulator [Ilumatobacter sp.]